MRTRVVVGICLALASACVLAMEPQTPVAWPPKAVPDPNKGKPPPFQLPDISAKNKVCLDCHGDVMQVQTKRKEIANPHRLHVDSKRVEFGGANRDCLTCHEMVAPAEANAPKKEGGFVAGGIFHPEWMLAPEGVWKKQIKRVAGKDGGRSPAEALKLVDPHLYKPTLKRLVCEGCHGPNSPIKTFYGAPVARQ